VGGVDVVVLSRVWSFLKADWGSLQGPGREKKAQPMVLALPLPPPISARSDRLPCVNAPTSVLSQFLSCYHGSLALRRFTYSLRAPSRANFWWPTPDVRLSRLPSRRWTPADALATLQIQNPASVRCAFL